MAKSGKVDCIKLLRKAGIVSDTEARDLLRRMRTLAQQRAAARGIAYQAALAEVAGEIKLTHALAHKIERRNRLLDIQTRRWAKDYTQNFKLRGDGAAAFLFGSEADVKGAGLGVWQIWQGMWGRYASRFLSELEQSGAMSDFMRGRYAREFYIESEQLGIPNGKPGMTNNKVALAVAKAWRDLRLELVSRINRGGGYIEEVPGYVLMQTHDRASLVKLDPKDMDKAFRQWRDTLINGAWLDFTKTFNGSDPELSLREIFKNLYTGNHESYLDAFDPSQFRAHGSLANRLSSPRVLWFKDADSAFKYNEMFGVRDYNQAILFHIRNMTKNIALMEKLGPNPIENWKRAIRELQVEVKDQADSNAQMKALDMDAMMRRFDVVSGKLDIPFKPSLSRWFGIARAFRIMSTGGKMVFSAFGDKPLVQMHMTHMGLSAMDALGKSLAGTFRTSKTAHAMQLFMGVVPRSLLGNVGARWGFELRTNYQVSGWLNRFFDFNRLGWWTDVHRSIATDGTASLVGYHSRSPMPQLPSDVARLLRRYDIGDKEWDAMRAMAYDVTGGTPLDGTRVITEDTFDRIANQDLDKLLTARGLTPNPTNRTRQRELLKTKYGALVVDSVDSAMNEPSARTKYATSLGGRAQSGTWFGEMVHSLMVYKSFPITVAMKMFGREVYGRGNETFKQWLMHDHQGKFRIAQLLAASFIAGYASMAMKDITAGRTPKRLVEDDGEWNADVLAAALLQSGAMGIYGDVLFSEYDARHRTFLGRMAGPVIGELDPAAAAFTKATGLIEGKEGVKAESLGYDAWKLGEQNLPFANLFYVKPVLDYFIFWNIREMLSPGVMRRTERSVEDRSHQEYWISPSSAASIPISDPGEKVENLLEEITE